MPEFPQEFKAHFGSGLKHIVKVFISGAPGVGKTSLKCVLDEITRNIFCAMYSQAGNDMFNRYVTITEDQPPAAVPTSNVHKWLFVDMYDICSEKSLTDIVQHRRARGFKSILVGNKIDMEFWRTVSLERGRDHAVGGKFVEVSALSGQHVDFIVDAILQELGQDIASLKKKLTTSADEQRIRMEQEESLMVLGGAVEKLKQTSALIMDELQNQSSLLSDDISSSSKEEEEKETCNSAIGWRR
jgi:tRNA U34 5-carboxymethylaminomethyl modifying GTPase MnmE/TrmE